MTCWSKRASKRPDSAACTDIAAVGGVAANSRLQEKTGAGGRVRRISALSAAGAVLHGQRRDDRIRRLRNLEAFRSPARTCWNWTRIPANPVHWKRRFSGRACNPAFLKAGGSKGLRELFRCLISFRPASIFTGRNPGRENIWAAFPCAAGNRRKDRSKRRTQRGAMRPSR